MQINLNLKQNAFHTLYQAIVDFRNAKRQEKSSHSFDHNEHTLVLKDKDGKQSFYLTDGYTRPPKYYDFKFCILHLIQAIELLLKDKLHTEEPDSIFTDNARTKTITLTDAINKIVKSNPSLFGKQQLGMLYQAKTLRNAIEHFEISWSAEQFEKIAKQLFSLILLFCYQVHNIRLSEYYSFDPWNESEDVIVETITELAQNDPNDSTLSEVISTWLQRNQEDTLVFCVTCGNESVSTLFKKCIICGQEINQELLSLLSSLGGNLTSRSS